MSTSLKPSTSTSRRRSTRRYDKDPMRKVMVRGLAFLVAFGIFAYVAIKTYSGVPGRSYDHVEATVPRTGNLIAHDPVRIGGRRVGQVEKVSALPDGEAGIRLQIESGNRLPVDSKIVIRADGLLGARYVEIVPGHAAQKLAKGQVIHGGAGSLTYGVTEALDTFDRQTRGDLGSMLGELGTGTLGQGQLLNDSFRLGASAIGPFDGMLRRLRAQPAANAALLPRLAGLTATLDANRRPLVRMLGVTATALQPLVDRRDAVRAALDQAPSALAAANTGLSRSRALLGAARSLATEATTTLAPAPGGLRATAALLGEARTPLQRTTTLLQTAGPTVPAVLRITRGATPLLQPLHELFSDSTTIANGIAPYGCDYTNFGAVFRSMTGMGGFGDGPNGPAMAFRLQAVAPPPGEAASIRQRGAGMHRDGYPAPCKYLSTPYNAFNKDGFMGAGR